MENNNKEVEQFNITSLWHKSIYECLVRTEDYEKICRVGGVEVAEALQQNPLNLSQIKFLYLKMFTVELRLLLSNSRAKLDKLFYLKSEIKLKFIQNDLDINSDIFLWLQINEITHEERVNLTEEYYDCLNILSEIRAECVWKLRDTLFGEIKEKAIGMDKNIGGGGLIR